MNNLILGNTIDMDGSKTVNQMVIELMTDISYHLQGKFTMKVWGRKIYVHHGLYGTVYGTTLGGNKTKKEFTMPTKDAFDQNLVLETTERLYNQYETKYSKGIFGVENRTQSSILDYVNIINIKDKLRTPHSIIRLAALELSTLTLDKMCSVISFLYALEIMKSDIVSRMTSINSGASKMSDADRATKMDRYNTVLNLLSRTTIN